MKLHLTQTQVDAMRPFLKPGQTLLARIGREIFDGRNADTSGSPYVEFGPVPDASLPSLREAVRNANNPAKSKRRKVAAPAE